MKILERPGKELVLILSTAAVATGGEAGIRAEKFRSVRAMRRAGGKAEKTDGSYETINCFTHSVKFVNGLSP